MSLDPWPIRLFLGPSLDCKRNLSTVVLNDTIFADSIVKSGWILPLLTGPAFTVGDCDTKWNGATGKLNDLRGIGGSKGVEEPPARRTCVLGEEAWERTGDDIEAEHDCLVPKMAS